MASSVRPITSGYMHSFREWEEKVSIQFLFWECLILTEEEEGEGQNTTTLCFLSQSAYLIDAIKLLCIHILLSK